MKLTQGILASALVWAALLAAPTARAGANDWIYTDDGSANRTPAIGLSATWQNLFHWEVFTAYGQGRVNHHPWTTLILR